MNPHKLWIPLAIISNAKLRYFFVGNPTKVLKQSIWRWFETHWRTYNVHVFLSIVLYRESYHIPYQNKEGLSVWCMFIWRWSHPQLFQIRGKEEETNKQTEILVLVKSKPNPFRQIYIPRCGFMCFYHTLYISIRPSLSFVLSIQPPYFLSLIFDRIYIHGYMYGLLHRSIYNVSRHLRTIICLYHSLKWIMFTIANLLWYGMAPMG